MALGYVAFSTLSNINGTVTNKVTSSYTYPTAKMKVNLKVSGDSMTYELTVINDGNLNAIIGEINAVS